MGFCVPSGFSQRLLQKYASCWLNERPEPPLSFSGPGRLDRCAVGGGGMTQISPTTNSIAARVDDDVDDDHTIVVAPEDRTIVIPPRTPDDYAVALPGGFRLWFSPPEAWLLRALEAMLGGQVAARKPRRPTLASVAKAASKAGIEVSRYEMKPDGSIVVVTGESEPVKSENPWPLDEFRTKETKQ